MIAWSSPNKQTVGQVKEPPLLGDPYAYMILQKKRGPCEPSKFQLFQTSKYCLLPEYGKCPPPAKREWFIVDRQKSSEKLNSLASE